MRRVAEEITFDENLGHRRCFFLLESGVGQEGRRKVAQFCGGRTFRHGGDVARRSVGQQAALQHGGAHSREIRPGFGIVWIEPQCLFIVRHCLGYATEPDKGWEPLISTPNHPEYPCGHCILAASAAEFMKAEVGNRPPLGVRVSSRSIPNAAVQALPSWDEWVRQVSYSRTLGGVHYRFSNEVAEEMGRKIAKQALAKVMRPLPNTKRRT